MAKKLNGSNQLQALADRAKQDGAAAANAINQIFLDSLAAGLYTANDEWVRSNVETIGQGYGSKLAGIEPEITNGSTMNYLESAND